MSDMTTIQDTTPTDLVLGIYRAVVAGDPAAAALALADDAILHVPGRQPLAGDHHGREAVLAAIAGHSNRAGRTERLEIRDVLAGADHVAVYLDVRGERDGRVDLENRTIHLFRIAAGRVAEIWFHNWDQRAVDAFWS